ncbi:MAG: heparan-alpha-glucosaminide N-acetyltransferase domain-containing protein [Chloroflexota bacterium]
MQKTSRLFALDGLRGLIMLTMALDHANIFISRAHTSGEFWGGSFPTFPDTISFLTRFVTHFSAPGFFFLMGIGMMLFAESRKDRNWANGKIFTHFLVRGLLLIAFQFLLENKAWQFGGALPEIPYFGVLYALGGTMLLAAIFITRSTKFLVVLGLALFIGTEIAIPATEQFAAFEHAPTLINYFLIATKRGLVFYPLLPWRELVIFGLVFGRWIKQDTRAAFRNAPKIGLGLLLGFILIRYLNGFGNLRPMPNETWMTFFNIVKYPPSWAFTLLTTGVIFIILGGLSKLNEKSQIIFKPILIFGQAPLFFYITHLFLYGWIGKTYFPNGTTIPQMYPYWLLGLLILFPLCYAFNHFKHNQPQDSLVLFL